MLLINKTTTGHMPADLKRQENECADKILCNKKIIEQFGENATRIGPILKARYAKNIAELERKNEALQKEIERYQSSSYPG